MPLSRPKGYRPYAEGMRIGVVGAGAVGGTLAALLDRAGHDVEVTARGAHLDALRSEGLHLDGAWGGRLARSAASETLARRPDLALVTTKAHDTLEAARQNAASLEGVPLLVVQNGLGGVDAVRAALPASPVAGGLALFAASYLAPGRVEVTASAPLVIQADAPGAQFVALLAPLMPVESARDFAGAQWTKLIVNQVNALPAVTGLSVQEVGAHPGLRAVQTRSTREAVLVALAGGVRFAALGGRDHDSLVAFAGMSVPDAETQTEAIARGYGDVPNPASTLQSIRRGRTTEIDQLNGAVVLAAERAGGAAPVNALLVSLVHDVERTGRFLAPDEVVRLAATLPVVDAPRG